LFIDVNPYVKRMPIHFLQIPTTGKINKASEGMVIQV